MVGKRKVFGELFWVISLIFFFGFNVGVVYNSGSFNLLFLFVIILLDVNRRCYVVFFDY